MRRLVSLLLLSSGVGLAACAGASPEHQPITSAANRAKPAQPEAGYCERLQPLLTKAGSSARIGTEMHCLDVPGVTELGRYGPPSAGEEATLAACFDEPADYEQLLDGASAEFDLDIEQAFSASTRAGAGASLGSLVPWLPRVELDSERTALLKAKVVLRKARFVTLIGLASKLQGQKREHECLQALCKPEYSYVNKALVGIPSLTLSAESARGSKVDVGAALVSSSFSSRSAQGGSREITSLHPVTLAIARSVFRTPQTERLCQFCGRRGQTCCAEGPACDGGLGCVEQQCVELGGRDQPCDGQSCAAGAACVKGYCRAACGGKGQPCCAGDACSGSLRCTPDPENDLEPLVAAEQVEVSGGFFGTSEDRTFGSSSCGPLRTRRRFALTEVGKGRGECTKAWWFDPKNDKDCRVAAHFEVSTFGSIACRVEVFATPPAKPNLCQP